MDSLNKSSWANAKSTKCVMGRREVIRMALGTAAVSLLGAAFPFSTGNAQALSAPRIVIVGAGAAGLSAASRLRDIMPRASIVLIDSHLQHLFQPGFTLVGAGVWKPNDVISATSEYVADGVEWVAEAAAEIDPDANAVTTSSGRLIKYDFLVVATGLRLDYESIEGMSPELIGNDGIASIYAGPEAAAASASAMMRFAETGGVGVFGRPATEMKCAGAPLKYTFITDDQMRRSGRRARAELIYMAHDDTLFGVPPVNDKVTELFSERDIQVRQRHVLEAIDPGIKTAYYKTSEGRVEQPYDFIHVVPPMRAPHVIQASALPWQDGPFAADGWIEVDRETLRHRRFANVFGIGDVNGVPKGKTAASVKSQTPVAVENLVAVAEGREPMAKYNGYTSCPLITGVGKAMLVEFDYDGRLTPSFPFIDPLKELWVSWAIEEKALRPVYFAMLRGRA